MQLSRCARAVGATLGLVLSLGVRTAGAGDVLAEISVRNRERPSTYHGEMFVFPDTVREYSRERFYGWSFRHDLRDGGVRLLEVARARTRGAYLMATDLFADGHYSTMSHTVLMVFPRSPIGRTDLYALSEDRGGYLRLLAPNGSALLVDGGSGAVVPTADFSLGPQGTPGTPPALWHRGLHLVIHSVGKSPFLRRTPVRVVDSQGNSCSLVTDELFAFGPGPESDVFRFDSDAQFFQYLDRRCPELALAPGSWKARSPAVEDSAALAFVPPSEPATTPHAETEPGDSPSVGGVLSFLSKLLSNRLWSNRL